MERVRLAGENGTPDDADMEGVEDPVPMITRDHFEEAFQSARKSVTTHDLYKFDEYRKKMDPSYTKRDGDGEIATDITLDWPEDASDQIQAADDDDDLYD